MRVPWTRERFEGYIEAQLLHEGTTFAEAVALGFEVQPCDEDCDYPECHGWKFTHAVFRHLRSR